jgi:DNA-binding transcriptional ArsR family regulator
MPNASSAPATHDEHPPGETSEARIAKVLAHPLRARILQRLGERVASPGDLAVELGAPLGVVSYGVCMLRDYDGIELVRTEPRRGALQHFYRATARPNLDADQWRTLPSGLRRELSGETIHELVDDLGEAADGGTLDDTELILSRMPLELDERGFKDAQPAARAHARAGTRDRRRELRPRDRPGIPDRARDPALQARPPRLAQEPALSDCQTALPFQGL